MKRIIALILAVMALLTFTACGSNDADNTGADDKNKPAESVYVDSLAVLSAIWNTYAEDDKIPTLGGNRDAMVENAPGAFDLTASEELTSSLLLPAENIPELSSAASLIHMMNANTFTSAVFQTDGDLDALSQTLIDAANSRQFLCGIPEMIVTLKVENYVIMAFGNNELIETFKNHALDIEGITLIHEGPITFTGGSDAVGGFGGIAIPIG